MKKIYILIYLLTISIIGFSQVSKKKTGFEGVITYRLMIESTNPTISTRDLQKMFGDTMQLFLKDDNYKMVFSGTYAQEVLYTGKDNKHFISLGPIDSLIWRSCNENASSAIYTQEFRDAGHIMNYACKAYSIQTDWGLTTYYYTPEIKLDPKNYRNHIFNYFNVYAQHARAPYLKYVYSGPSFKLSFVAVDIQESTLQQTAFTPVWKSQNKDENAVVTK